MKTRFQAHFRPPTVCVVLTLLMVPLICEAQWRTQTIELQPGWNAVHLEVQPSPDDCDVIFANTPVESVWKWNRRFSSIQFVQDPQSLLPEDPDWLVWLPLTNEEAFLRRLRSLQANQSYLIKVAENSGPVSLSIKGQVVLPRLDWYSHGLNLVGFPVNPVNPPTFADFFAFTDEVDTSKGFENELYQLNNAGRGDRIVQPFRDTVQPGTAYWVSTAGKPDSMAGLDVSAPGGELAFGSVSLSKDIAIQNSHPTDVTEVLLQLQSSEMPPTSGDHPELAGEIALSYLVRNEDGSGEWVELPAEGLSQTLEPGESWTLRLGLRREDLSPHQSTGANGASYQSILQVTDSAQTLLINVPVSATTPELSAAASLEGLGDFQEQAGLWVGEALLSNVNAPAYTTNEVISTPAPMTLRLLVHVDSGGTARLLQEVLLAWDPTLTDAPHTNGNYALYASHEALPSDASQVKRISSVGFPLMSPAILRGALTNQLDATLNITFDDPTNPFLHRYHPMHDNKDWDFVAYTNAVEVPTIVREIDLAFDENTNQVAHPIWGVDAIAGTYTETLFGLRAQPIIMTGDFALQRVSRIDQLQGITP